MLLSGKHASTFRPCLHGLSLGHGVCFVFGTLIPTNLHRTVLRALSRRVKLDVVLARQAQLQQLCDHYGIPARSAGSTFGSSDSLSNGADAYAHMISTEPQPAPVAA